MIVVFEAPAPPPPFLCLVLKPMYLKVIPRLKTKQVPIYKRISDCLLQIYDIRLRVNRIRHAAPTTNDAINSNNSICRLAYNLHVSAACIQETMLKQYLLVVFWSDILSSRASKITDLTFTFNTMLPYILG